MCVRWCESVGRLGGRVRARTRQGGAIGTGIHDKHNCKFNIITITGRPASRCRARRARRARSARRGALCFLVSVLVRGGGVLRHRVVDFGDVGRTGIRERVDHGMVDREARTGP